MDCEEIKVPEEFSDISPYNDEDFPKEIARLVNEEGFENAVKYVIPDVNYAEFSSQLLQIKNKHDFQMQIMLPFLRKLEKSTTKGVTASGMENIADNMPNVFLSNHRDIVLDASFLNLCLTLNGKPTTEIAIGNNLLIYPWIDMLVRLNKSFIVKRDTSKRHALEAAQHLSAYIHFAIKQKHQSVWIAQRQGRAKDSDDRTQESLVKMLALAGNTDIANGIKQLNLMPVSISYEYDPNDYLKAKEFLLRKKDPDFKKSQHDDLLSMETGLLQNKGHAHFHFSRCINDQLDNLPCNCDKNETAHLICNIIDKAIHSNYYIYHNNYIAYDILNNSSRFNDEYSADEKNDFCEYLNSQISKIDIPVNDNEAEYLRHMMLVMYANPLTNQLIAKGLEQEK